MKKKILWLGLSFLLVVALALSSLISSCGTKTSTSSAPLTSTTSTTPAVNTPQTGGTFTYLSQFAASGPISLDVATTTSLATDDFWTNPYGESLLKGDINKYGPRGDNTFSFQYSLAAQFGQFEGPWLATSWEVTSNPLGVVYHLRHGVMFTGNTKIGMASRELTADDVAYHLNRVLTGSPIKGILAYIKSITATDRYTVTILWNNFYAQWQSPIGLDDGTQGRIIPHEVVDAGVLDWQNQSGTGPFIISSYVSGSGATYTKNPNYWGTTTINGKSYQEPFIDKLVYPIIPDPSAQIAALRTGKIDMTAYVPMTNQASLASSSPQLIMQKWLSNRVLQLKFNTIGNSIFNSQDVRRAMYVATDLNAIAQAAYDGQGITYGFPFAPGIPTFTPLDQLPAADQLLFKYDATTAKQMLTAAGYPNGFACEVTVSGGDTKMQDIASVLVSQWSKVGVTLSVDVLDTTSYDAAFSQVTYKDSIMQIVSTDDPWLGLWEYRTGTEGCAVNNPTYNANYDDAQATQDDVQRLAKMKALGVYVIDQTYCLGFTDPYMLNCYWPWIQNYYGETTAGNYDDIMPMVTQLWIDQSMKTKLGY